MSITVQKWQTREEQDLTAENLQALFDNKIPAIRIRTFATKDESRALAAEIEKHEIQPFVMGEEDRQGDLILGHISADMAKHRLGPHDDKDGYFADVASAEKELDDIFTNTFNARDRLLEHIRSHAGGGHLSLATEPGYGAYMSCVIRATTVPAHAHFDFAPINAPGWAIDAIDAQIGINYYIQQFKTGGHTTVFNRPAVRTPQEDPRAEHLQRGRPGDISEEVERVSWEATVGDAVFFNSRNPHAIAGGEVDGRHPRIGLGVFLCRLRTGELMYFGD